jgi:ribosomal protein L21E
MEIGTRVRIICSKSNLKRKVPHKYHNMAGIITEKQGSCYKVEVVFNRKKYLPIISLDQLRLL